MRTALSLALSLGTLFCLAAPASAQVIWTREDWRINLRPTNVTVQVRSVTYVYDDSANSRARLNVVLADGTVGRLYLNYGPSGSYALPRRFAKAFVGMGLGMKRDHDSLGGSVFGDMTVTNVDRPALQLIYYTTFHVKTTSVGTVAATIHRAAASRNTFSGQILGRFKRITIGLGSLSDGLEDPFGQVTPFTEPYYAVLELNDDSNGFRTCYFMDGTFIAPLPEAGAAAVFDQLTADDESSADAVPDTVTVTYAERTVAGNRLFWNATLVAR